MAREAIMSTDDDARSVAEREIFDQLAEVVTKMENMGWHHLGVAVGRNILYNLAHYQVWIAEVILNLKHSEEPK